MIVRKLFYIAFFLPLMATRCPQETVNIQVKNSTDDPIVFGVEKHSSTLMPLKIDKRERFFRDSLCPVDDYLNLDRIKKDSLFYVGDLNIVEKRNKILLSLPEAFLSSYKSNDEKFYTFYFYKIKDKKIDKYNFDSIILKKNKIKIGEDENNVFEYTNDKIIFKNN